MSSRDRPRGLDDPDDWIGWWLSLHPSQLFAGELARFTLERLNDDTVPEGVGSDTIRFTEQDETIEVTIEYMLENLPHGRILHVLAIRSPEDPPRSG